MTSSTPFDLQPAAAMRDFSYLLHPQNFHPLPQHTIPAAFRTAQTQPSPSATLESLLSTGHFRAAAITAGNAFTNPPSHSSSQLGPADIFRLWYIRLASLVLMGSTATAAQEIKVFSDLSSDFYRAAGSGEHLVPWELRVLAVRLQAIGVSDWRRSIGLYYDLAREARAEILRREGTSKSEDVSLWRTRLRDLGVRVASALVEMGDLASAARHLESLRVSRGDASTRALLCLLYIRMGNLAAARQCLSSNPPDTAMGAGKEKVLSALIAMGEARWDDSVAAWKAIVDDEEGEEGRSDMARNNLAVCLLYTGDLKEARRVMETLIDSGTAFSGLTFNLSTIYELCSDNSKALKSELAERVAAQGKEMIGSSFKM